MKTISSAAADELRELVRSTKFAGEINAVAQNRHNPFMQYGEVNIDAYTTFVSEFNEFINHEPKKFTPMIAKDMRL